MEDYDRQETCPFLVVNEVSFELERASDLCYALGCVNDRDGVVTRAACTAWCFPARSQQPRSSNGG